MLASCRWGLEDTLQLPAPPTGLVFLPTSYPVPTVAVACGSHGVLIASRQRSGRWAALAAAGNLGLPVARLALGNLGMPTAAAGDQLVVLASR